MRNYQPRLKKIHLKSNFTCNIFLYKAKFNFTQKDNIFFLNKKMSD